MTRIWFNRWFSVAYHYMNMIRDNADGQAFEFYGTHPDIRHMSLQACDHAEAEPVLEGFEYVQYCLDFCRRHSIDIFIPRLKMEEIGAHVTLFEEIGTKVMVCGDAELLQSITVKDKFYELVKDTGIVAIPAYHVVNTADAFKAAYLDLRQRGHRVCFKPTHSEGGNGFRIIQDHRNPLEEIYGRINLNMSFEEAYSIFSLQERFDDIMVMELLEGDEYSIDCLSDSEGKLITAIPRRKSSGRTYHLDNIPELASISEKVAEAYHIPYVFNIQVKYNKGVPKLLEINPRMSGGLYITCLSGINIPYLAVKTILGQPFETPQPKLGIRASYVEQAVLLS
ncbi:carbamoyl-phosphate synthase large subunit [Paenibacillus sp. HJL G12]|uniref:Carbamoyl-phosphate synthase large subunit n=1 Tax=Paenibacillus dendrobii TaxID=2691084 RepID=A0A7X3LI39_9BACL|nr:ATP-grasp domain-containing protein [Paenibacillus dendrobii]MWV45727.1 carbamoyl-phosphate synthase large subunit [Paenibacillus dendrobii]